MSSVAHRTIPVASSSWLSLTTGLTIIGAVLAVGTALTLGLGTNQNKVVQFNSEEAGANQLSNQETKSNKAYQAGDEYPSEDSEASKDDDETASSLSSGSSEDEEYESSDSEEQCTARTSKGTQCTKRATANGACNRKSHQDQVAAQHDPNLQYNFNIPADQFNQSLDRLNDKARQRAEGNLIVDANANPGWIYVYQLDNGNIKIGRTGQTDPLTRWNQQTQYPEKMDVRAWWCKLHVQAETLILNLLDFARLEDGTEEFYASMVSTEDPIEEVRQVVRKVIKALHKKIRDVRGEEESSDLHSYHFSDQTEDKPKRRKK